MLPGIREEHPSDVVVDITMSCICESYLQTNGGWTAGEPDIAFGPENMGIVSEVGEAVSGGRIQTEGPRSFG